MSDPVALTVAQVAETLQMSRWTIYDRIRRHEIPTVTVGRAIRIPRRWLDQFMDGAGVASLHPQEDA